MRAGEAAVAITVGNRHGLHARPAARLVTTARGFDATVEVRNATTGSQWVPAGSLSRVATLGVLRGHRVEVRASGREAAVAVDAIAGLAARNFDEPGAATPPPAGTPPLPDPATGGGQPATPASDDPPTTTPAGNGEPAKHSGGGEEPTTAPTADGEPTTNPHGDDPPPTTPTPDGEPTTNPHGDDPPPTTPTPDGEPTTNPHGDGGPARTAADVDGSAGAADGGGASATVPAGEGGPAEVAGAGRESLGVWAGVVGAPLTRSWGRGVLGPYRKGFCGVFLLLRGWGSGRRGGWTGARPSCPTWRRGGRAGGVAGRRGVGGGPG
ncbi:hypothetical protein Asp14428_76110 [Actinoplanes sp. NBRC 14428]|nr:hypothetical protein Asp14428_76110 [Actinoplanes sp. NBRC 14428]